MRINKFLAQHTELSRRKADQAISDGIVTINGEVAKVGDTVKPTSTICLNGVEIIHSNPDKKIILLDKPVGYVCSRDGQGSPTVYELLSDNDRQLNLKIAGRLDKDSSGLVIMTNDGDLLNELTHPSNNKEKVYQVILDKELSTKHINILTSTGVDIGDPRPSKMQIRRLELGNPKLEDLEFKQQKKQQIDTTQQGSQLSKLRTKNSEPKTPTYEVILSEGRNRQIRRTFATIGYKVLKLHRTQIADYRL